MFWFVLVWGGAATVGAVIGPLQARVMPSLRDATQWLVRHRDLGPRYLAENTGGNAADTLRGYGVSYILGPAAVGYIQAAVIGQRRRAEVHSRAGVSLVVTGSAWTGGRPGRWLPCVDRAARGDRACAAAR